MASLGEVLRSARNKAHLSLKQVSERTTITNSRLSKMERDQIPCKLEELMQLINLYHASAVELFMAAGCLTPKDLESYQNVFSGVDGLDSEEKEHIQRTIDLLTKRKGKT